MSVTNIFKHHRRPIRLAGNELNEVRHVCAFFHSKAEEYDVLMPFIKDGIDQGEKAVHIIDSQRRNDHVCHLEHAGINVKTAQTDGQLEIRGWEDAYLIDGHFDQQRMLKLIQDVLERGKAAGFPATRLVANMEWALEDRPGVEDIVEYESRLNYILPQYHDPVICTYDLSKFDATVVMDILRTHPMVIIGGLLHENPFYTPPDNFLEELRARPSS